MFTLILQLSKRQMIKMSQEARGNGVSTTPWRTHCRNEVDVHKLTEGS